MTGTADGGFNRSRVVAVARVDAAIEIARVQIGNDVWPLADCAGPLLRRLKIAWHVGRVALKRGVRNHIVFHFPLVPKTTTAFQTTPCW
jgi:hypothetical protein